MDEYKEKLKNWIWKIKIYMWFIITEPWRFLYNTFRTCVFGMTHTRANKYWWFIYLVLLMGAIFAENRFAVIICLIAIIFMILRNIWKSGIFIYRWREVQKKRLEKDMEVKK